MANIHIARNGQSIGTFSEDQLREGIASGQFTTADLYWIEGASEWRPLGELAAQWGVEIPLPPSLPTLFGSSVAGGPETVPEGGEPAWERRGEIGFFPAIFGTIKGILFSPGTTYAGLKQTGGFGAPYLYLLIISLVVQITGIPYSLTTYSNDSTFVRLHQYLPGNSFMLTMIVAPIVLAPVICAISLFLNSGLIHLALMMLGGSKTPYETTFRINGYANGSIAALYLLINLGAWLLSLVIPPMFVSSFVLIPALGLFIWMLVCTAIGLQKCNAIEGWKAACAVIFPLIFCCCLASVLVLFGTLLFAGAGHMAGLHHP